MKNYNNILATLTKIDHAPAFTIRHEAEIVALLRESLVDKEAGLDNLAYWEFYAFSLLENSAQGATKWGTYSGSPVFYTETGEEKARVPLEKITPETVLYWEQRFTGVSSPLLKARYAGLVMDFKLKICGSRPNFHSFAVPYFQNLLQSVGNGSVSGFTVCKEKLRRALDLSLKWKNQSLKDEAVNAILAYQQTLVKPTGCATWRVSYDLLVAPQIVVVESHEYATV